VPDTEARDLIPIIEKRSKWEPKLIQILGGLTQGWQPKDTFTGQLSTQRKNTLGVKITSTDWKNFSDISKDSWPPVEELEKKD
jgi:hypothetical protein